MSPSYGQRSWSFNKRDERHLQDRFWWTTLSLFHSKYQLSYSSFVLNWFQIRSLTKTQLLTLSQIIKYRKTRLLLDINSKWFVMLRTLAKPLRYFQTRIEMQISNHRMSLYVFLNNIENKCARHAFLLDIPWEEKFNMSPMLTYFFCLRMTRLINVSSHWKSLFAFHRVSLSLLTYR